MHFSTYPYTRLRAIQLFKQYYHLSTYEAIKTLHKTLKDHDTWYNSRTSHTIYDKLSIGLMLTDIEMKLEKGITYEKLH